MDVVRIGGVEQEARLSSGVCYHIDDWTDIPIFYYSNAHDEIFVWGDGRIAWKDTKKLGQHHYFKSAVPEDAVAKVLGELIKCYSSTSPKRNHSTDCQLFLVRESGVDGAVFSSKFHKKDSWSRIILGAYKQNEAAITSSDISVALNHFSARTDFERGLNKNIKFSILCAYRDREKYRSPHSVDEFSPDDVRDYTAMFIADATYFVLFEKLIKDLVPNEPNLESKPAVRSFIKIHVKQNTDEKGNHTFVYEADGRQPHL